MDNITHSVIGLVAGDCLHRATDRHDTPSTERKRCFLLASVLGSNVPDLDIIYKFFYPHPVGTLLHHRGYTHTLFWAIPQALVVIGFLYLLRGGLISKRISTRDWMLVFGTSFVGVLLHIFADSWNSYGVHPFYPFDNKWYFGDSMFIIEPFLWAICGAWIIIEMSLAWRIIIFSLFGLVVGFGFSTEIISIRQIFLLIASCSVFTLLMGLIASSKRSTLALVFAAAVLGIFNQKGARAKALVARAYENEKIEDIAVSPLPLNPYCWIAHSASITGSDFVIRQANVSLWPERIPADKCNPLRNETSTVTSFVSDSSVAWNQEYRTPLGLFSSYMSDCYFREWMKFARMPLIRNGVARDVRFAFRGGRNFTNLILKPGRSCEEEGPPWVPPRANLGMESL